MTDWTVVNAQLMGELEGCDPVYQPTNFWRPGVQKLLGELDTRGIEQFKRWPQAASWFYPLYGKGLVHADIDRAFEALKPHDPRVTLPWVRSMLSGGSEAIAAFNLVRVVWDQNRWPFDLESHGESTIGQPPQRFPLTRRDDVTFGRPYINYLLSLAALSRHVDAPPRSFLEIGGGFGVLGEIVATRDTTVRYVDVDIPPLITVAAFYLSEVVGDMVIPTNLPPGPLELAGVSVVPSWRIGDVVGPFDVFLNSFSFQEMEPHVVANYVEVLAAIGVRWAVLLNSRSGKRRAESGREGGAFDPVTSDRVVEMFVSHGFRTVARHGQPLAGPVAELVVLEAE